MNDQKSPGPLRLWVVRHGVTDWNLEGRWQGHSDISLGARGRTDAAMLRSRLAANKSFDLVISSDLVRAHETAKLAGFEPLLESRLREVDFGRFEGSKYSDICHDPDYLAWLERPTRTRWPNGESYDDVQVRVRSWIDELPLEANVLAFTHGGVISVLASSLLGVEAFAAPRLWRFRAVHSGITVFERWQTPDGFAWTLERWNDTAHLED